MSGAATGGAAMPRRELLPPVLDLARAATAGLNWRALAAPESFARRTGGRPESPVELRFEGHAIEGVGQARWCGIASAKVEIFSFLVFPADADRLCVFASEFVRFGDSIRAAVVDLQYLGGDDGVRAETAAALRRAAAGGASGHARFVKASPYPEWCLPHFTDLALFTLEAGVSDLPVLVGGFEAYLREWAGLARSAAMAGGADWGLGAGGRNALADYKEHHRRSTPGGTFLRRTFGEEWTESFLADGMYA